MNRPAQSLFAALALFALTAGNLPACRADAYGESGPGYPAYGNSGQNYAAYGEGGRSYIATVGEKFGTGASNTVACLVEIPKTMYTSSQRDGWASGLTLGFFKGFLNTLGRALFGMTDMLTFMIPTKPMLAPALIWQDFGTETSYKNTWELYDTH